MNKGINILSIQKICIAYLIVWTISPPLSIDLPYRLLALAFAIIWMLVEISKVGITMSRLETYSLFFLLLVMVVALINGNMLSPIALYMFVLGFIMYNRHSTNLEELEGLQLLALVFLIIWNIRTYSVLLGDVRVAREIVRNDESTYVYLRQGVGGYGHIICQTILSPVLFSWSLSAWKKHKICFVLGMTCFISFVLVLSAASYAIPLLATIIGIILYFIGKGSKIWPYILIPAILIIVLLLLIGYVEGFREWLIKAFPSNTTQNKVNDLLSSLESGELQGDFLVRFQRYIFPIESFFLKYPLIGGLWNGGSGAHSMILDSFGQYGLFGGWIICKLLFFVPSFYRKEYFDSIKIRKTSTAFISVLLVSMLFDSWAISCAFLLFIVVPLLFNNIVLWEQETKKVLQNKE